MTVRDLIKELVDCNPEWLVFIDDSDKGLIGVEDVEGNRGEKMVVIGSDEE